MKAVLSVLPSNSQTERIFSCMDSIWTDARNKLSVEHVKALLVILTNIDLSCAEFAAEVKHNKKLLTIIYSQKYKFKTTTAE